MKTRLFTLSAVAGALMSAAVTVSAQEELHIFNWSDYIAEDTIANFEKETGIKVTYDVYDSNEVLEAKLLAGHSGYDLVFPTAMPFADRGIRAGLYKPYDKSQLTHYGNLDKGILKTLSSIDPGNQYLVPYMWGTSGIAYNVDEVKKILGDDMPLDTWRLLFDPEITKKLASCGLALMDDATEVLAAANLYMGKNPNDYSKKAINDAAAAVAAVRDDIRYFHSSQTINDMANGDICVAHGYSGDMLQAQARAEEAGNGVHIQYVVPAEGAVFWTDVAVMPVDAPHADSAQKFVNYLLRPEVIAPITDYVAYANANTAATALVDESVRNNPGIYPAPATQEKLVVLQTPADKDVRYMTRVWSRTKSGN